MTAHQTRLPGSAGWVSKGTDPSGGGSDDGGVGVEPGRDLARLVPDRVGEGVERVRVVDDGPFD